MNNENGRIIFKWIMDSKSKEQHIKSYINKLYIDYIATRPGVDLDNDEHGLFGYMQNSENVESFSLDKISKYIQNINNKKVKIFKTIISLREEDAVCKALTNKNAWKCLIKDRIRGIAEEYDIEYQNLEWVASFHMEKGHPHTHLVFWDTSELNDFKKRKYVNFKNIRKHIAKGIFKEDLNGLYDMQNKLKKDISTDFNKFKLEFNEEEKILNQLKEEMPEIYNNPILNYKFINSGVNKINANLNELKDSIKNYKYQEQTKEVKKLIDDTSRLILNSSRNCFNTFEDYIKINIKIGELLGQTDTPEQLQKTKMNAEKFMLNKMGNQILKFLKNEEYERNMKEKYEKKLKEYEEHQIIKEQEYLEEQLNYLESQGQDNAIKLFKDVYNLLSQENISIQGKYGRLKDKYANLSKQAKKELYLEQRNSSGIDWFTL